ncbi:MAG: hypothetical protein AABX07_01320 [Nanoarchaeota archaeon]
MDYHSHIHLSYISKQSSHVRDSLYHIMIGDFLNHQWEIGEAKLKASGLELIHNSIRCDGIPSAAVFHHYPSGSSVVVTDDYFNPSVEIYGSQRESAKSSLVELVKPFGFELKEEVWQPEIAAAIDASGRGLSLEVGDDGL